MAQKGRTALFVIALLMLVASSYGQSLGDLARQQRETKQNTADHKVITNDDIPESPNAPADASANDEHETPSAPSSEKKSGDQWKAEIQAQRNAVASLQNQIDKLNSSIHFVEANRYRNGVQWNEQQLKKQDQVERMQAQLEEQKKKLEGMQDDARKQGFGNSVYEPPNPE